MSNALEVQLLLEQDRCKPGTPSLHALLRLEAAGRTDKTRPPLDLLACIDVSGSMAGGKLRVIGSPQHLKSRHGGGYRVQTSGPTTRADEVCAIVRRTFETVELLEAHGGTQCFEVGANFALGDAFAALEDAKGTTFDRLWLEGMIQHHEGALMMASHIADRGDDARVQKLSGAIEQSQTAEIAEMKQLLGQ